MRSNPLSIALLGLALVGCADRTVITEAAGAPLNARVTAKPVTYPTVSLTVTVASVDALGGATAIQGDGQGQYVDGSQNVQAVLDQYGSFIFNTNTSNARKAAVRWLTYNFNAPVDPANTYRPSTNTQVFTFATAPSSFSAFTAVQNLGVNGNPVTECIAMGGSLSGATSSWKVSFHRGLEDVSNTPTAFAVVTRTSVSPAVWTIAPVGSCSANGNVAALRSGDGAILYGYYALPFVFTLRAR